MNDGRRPLRVSANKRELADRQHLAADVDQRAVRLALVVAKDPQVDRLAGQRIGDFVGVGMSDTHQHDQSGADTADHSAIDTDLGARHALEQQPHRSRSPSGRRAFFLTASTSRAAS